MRSQRTSLEKVSINKAFCPCFYNHGKMSLLGKNCFERYNLVKMIRLQSCHTCLTRLYILESSSHEHLNLFRQLQTRRYFWATHTLSCWKILSIKIKLSAGFIEIMRFTFKKDNIGFHLNIDKTILLWTFPINYSCV